MVRTAHLYKESLNSFLSRPVEEVANLLTPTSFACLGHVWCLRKSICLSDKKDTGFEVSSDDIEPTINGADDQTDAIPTSSSSDSLSMSDEPDASPSLPTQSDILVSYSTFPGMFVCAFLLRRLCLDYLLTVQSLTWTFLMICPNVGYVSWRLTLSGSWYVKTLDRILAENAATHDLVTILTMVSFYLKIVIFLVFIIIS